MWRRKALVNKYEQCMEASDYFTITEMRIPRLHPLEI